MSWDEAILNELEDDLIAQEQDEPKKRNTDKPEEKPKTLKDRLSWLNNDEFVYLGCKSGSGWMFIGTVADLRLNLYRLNNKYIKANLTVIRKRRIDIARYEKEYADTTDKLEMACEKLAAITDPSEFWKCLKEIQQLHKSREFSITQKQKAERNLNNAYHEVFNWVKFEDREIVEEYHTKHVPPTGWVLLLPGNCMGKYWYYYDEVLKEKSEVEDLDRKEVNSELKD